MANKADKLIKEMQQEKIEQEKPKTECESDYKDNIATVTTKSIHIRTVPQALEYAKVDLKTWEVARHTIGFSEVTMGLTKSGTGRPETYTNYNIKIYLRRIVIKDIEESIKRVLSNYKPLRPKVYKYDKKTGGKNMLEVSLFDHHFGMLAWKGESANNYDIKIAATRYRNGVDDLLTKASVYSIDKILLPIGQDFFHINDPSHMTPAARNQLDAEGRLAKVYDAGVEACIRAVGQCASVAPTEVIWVPGNHDPETSFYLVRTLYYAFQNYKQVTVDKSSLPRKFQHYGISLIGYTHGNEESWKSLPTIMADEKPELWPLTKCHEWHVGHNHKKKKMDFISVDSFGSTTIRMLPSLAGTDHWHYKKGYIGGNRCCEAYLYNFEEGYSGHISANVRD